MPTDRDEAPKQRETRTGVLPAWKKKKRKKKEKKGSWLWWEGISSLYQVRVVVFVLLRLRGSGRGELNHWIPADSCVAPTPLPKPTNLRSLNIVPFSPIGFLAS